MTSPAIRAGLLLQMTIYAAFHGMNGALADSVHLFHISMTPRTRYLYRNMSLMTEVDEVRQIVNLYPFDRAPPLPVLGKLLNLRLVLSDIFVAPHTKLHGGYSRRDGAARIYMAVGTRDLVVVSMELMTEVDRLHRRGVARVESEDCDQYG